MAPALLPLWAAMLDAVRLRPGMRLLDAGCGSGESAALALAREAEVWGLDCSEEMLAVARRTAPRATLAHGDLETLPYPDSFFDAITACNSVHFAADPLRAMRELARVARPGSRIAITSTGTREELQVRSVIFEPAFALLDGAPPANPFLLSEPGVLEQLMADAGLATAPNLKVLTEWSFASFDEAWAAWRTIGPIAAVIKTVGEEAVRAAVEEAANRIARRPDGEESAYVLRNWWHVVAAEPA